MATPHAPLNKNTKSVNMVTSPNLVNPMAKALKPPSSSQTLVEAQYDDDVNTDAEVWDGNKICIGNSEYYEKVDWDCTGFRLLDIEVSKWGSASAEKDRKSCSDVCSEHPSCVGFSYPSEGWTEEIGICQLKHSAQALRIPSEGKECGDLSSTFHYYTLSIRNGCKPTGKVNMDMGFVTNVDSTFQTVFFDVTFDVPPVVVVSISTIFQNTTGKPIELRLRAVSQTGFEVSPHACMDK